MIKTSVTEHEKKWVQCLIETLLRWKIRIILESPTNYRWIVPNRRFSLGKKEPIGFGIKYYNFSKENEQGMCMFVYE